MDGPAPWTHAHSERQRPPVWRHRGESGRIHFAIERPNGQGVRHLIIDQKHTLYKVFEEWFETIGYTGPRVVRPTTKVEAGRFSSARSLHSASDHITTRLARGPVAREDAEANDAEDDQRRYAHRPRHAEGRPATV